MNRDLKTRQRIYFPFDCQKSDIEAPFENGIRFLIIERLDTSLAAAYRTDIWFKNFSNVTNVPAASDCLANRIQKYTTNRQKVLERKILKCILLNCYVCPWKVTVWPSVK